GHGSIQAIKVRDLDVFAVFIITFVVVKWNSLLGADVVAFFLSAGGDPHDSAKRVISHIDSHSDIYERYAEFFQFLDDEPSRAAAIDADEDETHAPKLLDIRRGDIAGVADDTPVNAGVDSL